MFEGENPGPLAYPGYRSARFDGLINEAEQAMSEDALQHAWQGALRLLGEDLPTTWLYFARGLQGANHRIENTTIDFRGELAGIAGWRIRGFN